MIADGVDVIFPLLNVISLPGYIGEMVTQGVQPGQIQFYQSGYNAQNGDLVSSKVVVFGGEAAGALYNGTKIVAPGATGAFRLPDFEPNEFARDVQPRVPGGGRRHVHARPIPETNSAYGATVGMCTFIRTDRARDRGRGPEPDARGPRGRGRGPRRDRHRRRRSRAASAPGKYTAPNALNLMTFNYPCAAGHAAVRRHAASSPRATPFPIPSGD